MEQKKKIKLNVLSLILGIIPMPIAFIFLSMLQIHVFQNGLIILTIAELLITPIVSVIIQIIALIKNRTVGNTIELIGLIFLTIIYYGIYAIIYYLANGIFKYASNTLE